MCTVALICSSGRLACRDLQRDVAPSIKLRFTIFLHITTIKRKLAGGMRTHFQTLYMSVWLGPEPKPTARAPGTRAHIRVT
jgi:hypothetical protein